MKHMRVSVSCVAALLVFGPLVWAQTTSGTTGAYTITYELLGFTTVTRQGIRVSVGFTATVDVEVGVASLAESVTVTGQAPVVDLSSTELTTTFDKNLLAAIPSGSRDFWSLLATTPSVQVSKFDVGGSAAMTVLPVSVSAGTPARRS